MSPTNIAPESGSNIVTWCLAWPGVSRICRSVEVPSETVSPSYSASIPVLGNRDHLSPFGAECVVAVDPRGGVPQSGRSGKMGRPYVVHGDAGVGEPLRKMPRRPSMIDVYVGDQNRLDRVQTDVIKHRAQVVEARRGTCIYE